MRPPPPSAIPRLIAAALAFFCMGGFYCGITPANARGASPFGEETLLTRFDANRNGRLDDDEKQVLREAFGGIDVPMLPRKPHDYTNLVIPTCFDKAELDELDNTSRDNPLTDHGAALGRVLFYDRRLSKNDSVACAACHLQEKGFADPRRLSLGFEGGHTHRNAMSLANLRFNNLKARKPGFFWDERAATLEVQTLIPIQDRLEMGMELADLEKKLQKLPYYPPLFEAAFHSPTVKSDRISKALAQFLRSLVSFDSKFDRAAKAGHKGDDHGHHDGDFPGFTRQENLGKSLFMNGVGGIIEFGCAMCHVPPTFSMAAAANNGLELKYKDRGLGALDRPSNDPFTPDNEAKFKAPSLRNIELTAPYMHDGRFKTLEEVIEHYSSGVQPHPNLGMAFAEENKDQGKTGLRLNREQKAALVAFLKTLTDKQFVADPKFSDPFIRTRP